MKCRIKFTTLYSKPTDITLIINNCLTVYIAVIIIHVKETHNHHDPHDHHDHEQHLHHHHHHHHQQQQP
jgi:hypothetical protein